MAQTEQPFSVPVIFTELDHEPKNTWTDYGPPERRTIAKGWVKEEGRKAFTVDTVWEKDIRIPLRDGVELLADVFRPLTSDDKPVPAIMPWSHYGKTGTGIQQLDMFPWRVGVPRSETSGLEKWEAPDPAEWVARGYAVVNIDARGAFKSGGDLYVYGTQEGRDGFDCIEWIAQQSWCNERVAMAGNSWLGTTQWFIAAEQPPHLACMAPWEGLGDYYRESICRGGIPDHAFWDLLMNWTCGPGKREDAGAMAEKYRTWNDYWEDKKPKLRNIVTPMYATASFSTRLHTEGSLRGFQLSRSSEKWLRWIVTQEWHDLYRPENVDDLQRFFDKYMLDKDNGWEKTPRVRYSLLGYNRPSIIHMPADQYPPAKFRYETLFLDAASGTLGHSKPLTESVVEYQADSPSDNGCSFTYTFKEYTELCGISKARVYMSTPDHDDMDVYVVLRKLDKSGRELWHKNIPMEDLPEGTVVEDIPNHNVWRYIGPNGRLRASHRAVSYESLEDLGPDEYNKLMGPAYVYHPHTATQPLRRDQIVELDISLWPGGIIFDAGESMRLEFAGQGQVLQDFDGVNEHLVNYNVGRHRLHTGGGYESQFLVNLWRSGQEDGNTERA
ncbi:acylase diesterase [Fusarium pseudoanthophilum]|uniref:Acylase diesterase n=1 Tax=Fusarium pseudoanthophilum TaxID=48495 RepID=A0A8H5NVR2_9HYPO|nr:acylase diesterase [Fusarium pseudoanthophilum]